MGTGSTNGIDDENIGIVPRCSNLS